MVYYSVKSKCHRRRRQFVYCWCRPPSRVTQSPPFTGYGVIPPIDLDVPVCIQYFLSFQNIGFTLPTLFSQPKVLVYHIRLYRPKASIFSALCFLRFSWTRPFICSCNLSLSITPGFFIRRSRKVFRPKYHWASWMKTSYASYHGAEHLLLSTATNCRVLLT